MSDKTVGFRIDEYFITFPPGEFIKEDEDGEVYISVDIYKMDKDNKPVAVPKTEVSEQLEQRISAYINEMLMQAVERAEKEGK